MLCNCVYRWLLTQSFHLKYAYPNHSSNDSSQRASRSCWGKNPCIPRTWTKNLVTSLLPNLDRYRGDRSRCIWPWVEIALSTCHKTIWEGCQRSVPLSLGKPIGIHISTITLKSVIVIVIIRRVTYLLPKALMKILKLETKFLALQNSRLFLPDQYDDMQVSGLENGL